MGLGATDSIVDIASRARREKPTSNIFFHGKVR